MRAGKPKHGAQGHVISGHVISRRANRFGLATAMGIRNGGLARTVRKISVGSFYNIRHSQFGNKNLAYPNGSRLLDLQYVRYGARHKDDVAILLSAAGSGSHWA